MGNIMFRRVGGKVYGVLNDFDLSSFLPLRDEPSSKWRTGTRPYMSRDLLTKGWCEGPLYRHDLESLFYIMLILCCHYKSPDKALPFKDWPYKMWFTSDDATVAEKKESTATLSGHGEQLVDKLAGVFHQVHDYHDPAVNASTAQPAPQQPYNKIMGKVADVFESEEVRKKRLDAEEAERKRLELETRKARSGHHGFMDKISGAFEGEEARKKRLEGEEAERKRLELEAENAPHHLPLDMFSKLGLGSHIPPPILDKLGSRMHLSNEQATSPFKEETLAGKIESSIHHKQSDDSKTRPHTLGEGLSDKIQSALGGGSKAEDNEDDLDKAIDFVQKHIFKQGSQSQETILEQMKDEKIASTIRAQYKGLTGHEFPLKKGEKRWL
ncbi:hypothetical protein D9757_010129 [Collybiopsis confluens]|uniref:Fungal-type protein kinase domain-containing protein n=1 Tax=Collybiopsis confluens TaxID=2823264 RepID=A0A8H5GSS0_9AGAR|nr:hypothetical protein D9757_010129 [Collybiopsis confluens]